MNHRVAIDQTRARADSAKLTRAIGLDPKPGHIAIGGRDFDSKPNGLTRRWLSRSRAKANRCVRATAVAAAAALSVESAATRQRHRGRARGREQYRQKPTQSRQRRERSATHTRRLSHRAEVSTLRANSRPTRLWLARRLRGPRETRRETQAAAYVRGCSSPRATVRTMISSKNGHTSIGRS